MNDTPEKNQTPDGAETGHAADKRTAARGISAAIFVFFLSLYILNASGHTYSADGIAMVSTALSLAQGRGFALEPGIGRRLENQLNPMSMKNSRGVYYAKYSPLNSVLLAPAAAVGLFLQRFAPPGSPPLFAVMFAASFLNAFVTALTVLALFQLCLAMGLNGRVSAAAACLFGGATIALPYAKMCFSEPMAALLITACFAGIAHYRRNGARRWLAVAAAAALLLPLARLSAVISLVPIVLYSLGRRSSWKGFFTVSAAGAAGLFIHGIFNYSRFGSFLATGYNTEIERFSTPLIAGLYGLLISSDKSFFVYSPVAILALFGIFAGIKRGKAAEMECAAGILAINVVFYAGWHSWEGGHAWGPRFLVPAIPACMAAAAFFIESASSRALRKAAIVAVAAVSIAVQLAATSAKFIPQYENYTVKQDIETAYAQGRLFKPGAPRFLPMKAQFRTAAAHYAYTVSHFGEYFRSGQNSFEDLRQSKLVENAPDFWIFLVWLSVGWKLRAAALAVFLSVAAVGAIHLRALCARK